MVEVDDPDCADAGEGQVESDGRAEAAGADDEHLRVDDLALTDAADLGHDDVARVARHLLRRQRKARAVVSGWGAAGEGGDNGHLGDVAAFDLDVRPVADEAAKRRRYVDVYHPADLPPAWVPTIAHALVLH